MGLSMQAGWARWWGRVSSPPGQTHLQPWRLHMTQCFSRNHRVHRKHAIFSYATGMVAWLQMGLPRQPYGASKGSQPACQDRPICNHATMPVAYEKAPCLSRNLWFREKHQMFPHATMPLHMTRLQIFHTPMVACETAAAFHVQPLVV